MIKAVLVAGATGRQGGAVVRHLLNAGWHPRALTRDPESPRACRLRDRGVEVVKGDMNDEDSLRPLMEGVQGVFSVQAHAGTGPREEVRQGLNMANAALKTRVGHFVYSSLAGAGSRARIDPFVTKHMVEGHLRWIGLSRTILRPVRFMENLLRGPLEKGLKMGRFLGTFPADRIIQMVSVEDIGAFAAAAFLDPERFSRRVIELAGDELTNQEMAQRMADATGRDIRFQKVPGLLIGSILGKETHQIHRWLDREGFSVDIQDLRRSYPDLPLLSFRDWLKGAPLGSVNAIEMNPAIP